LEHLLRLPDRFPGEETTQEPAEPVVASKPSLRGQGAGQIIPLRPLAQAGWPGGNNLPPASLSIIYSPTSPLPLAYLGLGRVIHRFSVF
jgi:hypothetical protein